MYVTMSPAIAADNPVIHQIFVRPVVDILAEMNEEKDEDASGWVKINAEFPAILSPKEPVLRKQIDPLLDEGYYVFRSRLVTAKGEIGPWSPKSAPVYVM